MTLHDGWMLTSLSIDSESVADKVALTSAMPLQGLKDMARLESQSNNILKLSANQENNAVFKQIETYGFALLALSVDSDRGLRFALVELSDDRSGDKK